jgi:L-threonylcarbamoyladenylate synthase
LETGDDDIERAIAAVRAGRPVLLPTDTVYGLATSALRDEYAADLYRVKGRAEVQPTALVASSLDMLFASLPELEERERRIAAVLLPGPFTLVVPNPARRFRWLTGARTDTIGVRVPLFPEPARRVVDATGCILATSANEPGGHDPATLDDVPERIREACAAAVDAGPLPGTASTVIDFTGDPPFVIREGAASSAEALSRVRSALTA